MPSKIERQKAHFESLSQEYFSATQHPNCVAFTQLAWAHFLKPHSSILCHGAKVLEPMCGQGIAKTILEQNFHSDFTYSGFDYSAPLVEIAQQRMPNDHIFLQDVTTFETAERYDLIFLSGGLHHGFEQTQSVLARLRNVLKPGGYMISLEPTYDNPLYGWIGQRIYKNNSRFDAASEQRYALSALNESYRAAGFSIVDQMHAGLGAYIMSISSFCFPKLAFGSPAFIHGLVKCEAPLYRQWLGRKFSFSAHTLLKNSA